MGRWAQARKRGSTPPGSAVLPVGPVITFDDPNIVWTWVLPDPGFWQMQESVDEGETWNIIDTVDGDARSWEIPHSGVQFRIFGSDAEGIPTTGYSNALTP